MLVLYPRSFRADYAAPMVQVFGDRLRDVGARAWLQAIPDLVRTVPGQRIEAVMSRLSPAARVLVLAAVVLGLSLLSIGLGGGLAPGIAVAVLVVVVAQRRRFASLPLGERAPLRRAVIQTWWAPVATLLGFAMILGGFGTIFEATNLAGRIFGSALLFAFGLTMLLGLMRRPFDRVAGNSLILLATVPAFPFFWLLVPPVAGILVWVGVLSSGFSDQELAAATT
jgi:hypothetical protein